jgi:hypothetical protein
MKLLVRLFVLVVTLSLAGSAVPPAGAETVSEDYASTAAIYEIGSGARITGMGGAFIGLADDENAAVYNPAGLGFLRGGGINTTYDRKYGALTYNSAVVAAGPLGFAGSRLSSDSIAVTDKYGVDTGKSASYSSTALIGSLGIPGGIVGVGGPSLGIGLGLQFRSFRSELFTTTGSGFDLALSGLIRASPVQNTEFRFGAILPGSLFADSLPDEVPFGEITYEDSSGAVVHEESFPDSFGLGFGLKLGSPEIRTNLAVDWDSNAGISAGLEQRFDMVAGRLGINGSGNLTAGGGLEFDDLSGFDARLDAAYTLNSELAGSWTLTFSLSF